MSKFTKEEINHAAEVMAEVARQAREAEAEEVKAKHKDAMAAYEDNKKKIKEYIKKGFDNPGWLSMTLKISVTDVEQIRRIIAREIEHDREKETLKIPGIP